MKKTIRFVTVVLCSDYGSLDEWTEQVVCDINSSSEDILAIVSNLLLKQGYNLENFDLEVIG